MLSYVCTESLLNTKKNKKIIVTIDNIHCDKIRPRLKNGLMLDIAEEKAVWGHK